MRICVLIRRIAALQILPSAYNTRLHGELAVCTCKVVPYTIEQQQQQKRMLLETYPQRKDGTHTNNVGHGSMA